MTDEVAMTPSQGARLLGVLMICASVCVLGISASTVDLAALALGLPVAALSAVTGAGVLRCKVSGSTGGLVVRNMWRTHVIAAHEVRELRIVDGLASYFPFGGDANLPLGDISALEVRDSTGRWIRLEASRRRGDRASVLTLEDQIRALGKVDV